MDPLHLAAVCESFSLGTPLSVEEDQEGVLNRNYDLVTDSGQYFIKSVRDRRKDAIPVIAAAETFMREGDIPAIEMLRTKEGALFVPAGEDVYTVYPYIAHSRPQEEPYGAMGAMLARIHTRGSGEIPAALQTAVMVEKGMVRAEEKLHEYKTRAEGDTSSYKDVFLEYIDTKLSLLSTLPPSDWQNRVLAHGDYHDRNILFNADDGIVGICDWEKAELVPRAYEIARSIQYICFKGRSEENTYELSETVPIAREFLGAYRSITPIEHDELIAGFSLRLRKLVMSFWIEERFYDHADDRANKFIEHETRLMQDFRDSELVEAIIG
jgi:Ser/Thr protein kinase RdoA (MazF antagonist)